MGKFGINAGEKRIGLLMSNISRLHATRADQSLEAIGLFRGQAILLMLLSHQDGLTHSEIAEKLEISPAAATKVIKRMEALHYLQRRPDPADERISRVFLEEESWTVIRQIKNAFQQIDQILLTDLSPDEKDMLIKLLNKVYANLLEQPAGSPEIHQNL